MAIVFVTIEEFIQSAQKGEVIPKDEPVYMNVNKTGEMTLRGTYVGQKSGANGLSCILRDGLTVHLVSKFLYVRIPDITVKMQ